MGISLLWLCRLEMDSYKTLQKPSILSGAMMGYHGDIEMDVPNHIMMRGFSTRGFETKPLDLGESQLEHQSGCKWGMCPAFTTAWRTKHFQNGRFLDARSAGPLAPWVPTLESTNFIINHP